LAKIPDNFLAPDLTLGCTLRRFAENTLMNSG